MRDPDGDNREGRSSGKGRCTRGACVELPLRGSLRGFGGN